MAAVAHAQHLEIGIHHLFIHSLCFSFHLGWVQIQWCKQKQKIILQRILLWFIIVNTKMVSFIKWIEEFRRFPYWSSCGHISSSWASVFVSKRTWRNRWCPRLIAEYRYNLLLCIHRWDWYWWSFHTSSSSPEWINRFTHTKHSNYLFRAVTHIQLFSERIYVDLRLTCQIQYVFLLSLTFCVLVRPIHLCANESMCNVNVRRFGDP